MLGRLDDAIGARLGRYATDPVEEPGETLRGLAVDGKAVRGSRTDAGARAMAAMHNLAIGLVRQTGWTNIAAELITTGNAPSTPPPCSISLHENASALSPCRVTCP